MPVYPSEAETGGGKGIVWLDESGGYIVFTVSLAGYTRLMKLHIGPFDATGSYTGVAGGQEQNLNDTAANVIANLQLFYPSTVGIAPLAAYQSNAAHDGVNPFSYAFAGGLTVVGTNVNAATSPAASASLVGHGSDFSRWQTHLLGVSSNLWPGPGRRLAVAVADAFQTFANYLTGAAAGVGLAGHGAGKNTNIVSHSNSPLVSPIFVVWGENRRVARRLHIA